MNLLMIGCNYRTAPVELRERMAIPSERIPATLRELLTRFGGEAVVLGTCNRLEMYLAEPTGDVPAIAQYLAESHRLPLEKITAAMYSQRGPAAARHLFRVAASLDSLVVGEGQIAGQVKQAYELACTHAAVGPLLHGLFQQARVVAKRVRRETGISRGHVSVSSLAVDYVRQVFTDFSDKTVLVIGAGKMGRLTLKQLKGLGVGQILVTNRSPERAIEVAAECGGKPIAWEQLDDAVVEADIVLSTTGAPEPVMTAARFEPLRSRRNGPLVVLDIAVPRDFDPAIHDGDSACIFNIDDLEKVRTTILAERMKHVPPAEAIVEREATKFVGEWARRRNGPVIARLTADLDAKRQAVLTQLLNKLDGKLSDADRQQIEGAFRLLQNQFLHGPISALGDATKQESHLPLLDAIRHLFRLKD